MTVKQISGSVGKKERAIHNWIKKASALNAAISAKIAQAKSTSKPADYDFEETCSIIEIGMGKNAAGIFRANAEKSYSLAESNIDVMSKFLTTLQVISETNCAIMKRLNQLEEKPRIEYKQDYFTIIGYANYKGIKDIATSDAMKLSVQAKKISIENGKEIRKVPDERWGVLNSYHIDILKKVFEL